MSEFREFMEKKKKAEALKQKREEKKKKEEEEQKQLQNIVLKRKEMEEEKKRKEEEKKQEEAKKEKKRKEEEKKQEEAKKEEKKKEEKKEEGKKEEGKISGLKRTIIEDAENICTAPKRRGALDLTMEEDFFPSYITDSDSETAGTTPQPRKTSRPLLHISMPNRILTMPTPVHGYQPRKTSTPKLSSTVSRPAETIVEPDVKPDIKQEPNTEGNQTHQQALISALTNLTEAQVEMAASMRDFARSLVSVSRAIDRAAPLYREERTRDSYRENRSAYHH